MVIAIKVAFVAIAVLYISCIFTDNLPKNKWVLIPFSIAAFFGVAFVWVLIFPSGESGGVYSAPGPRM